MNGASDTPAWTLTAEVLAEDHRWAALDIEALCERAFGAVLTQLGVTGEVEVSVLACGDRRIAELNADFRGKPQATNVLSWPSEERGAVQPGTVPAPLRRGGGPVELGDIALAFETCAAEAAAAGIAMADHVTHLSVHALLHLMGYDHERDADAELMEQIETRILGKLGVADPYRPDRTPSAAAGPAALHPER